MTRKAALLRSEAARSSQAPRYLSLTDFADSAGVPSWSLSRWLRSGHVWVPRPAVLLGAIERPGWQSAVVVD
ncbi:hypothetical protein [Nocardia carnea]|uniref:hypothetical protein n=1 Tax=Nocardia carnea TaxID=37328 RepID=UPI002454AAAB|nr:hypothetical protein [Nocardia carnea]